MTSSQTVPHRPARIPVLTVRADVESGRDAGRTCTVDGETLTIGTAETADLVMTDDTVSRYHVELARRPTGIAVTDHGSTNGTFIGEVLIERAVVSPGTLLRVGRSEIRVLDGERTSVELLEGRVLGDLRGQTPVMRRLMTQVQKLAESNASVLLVGESGTGKELVARALHDVGPRAAKPFETIDCGSLSPTLVASELFGHERGAFTGADRQHIGAIERANEGTLFLDEIGELPPALQSTLLGVLERRRFTRLGGREPIDVDVRLVSATNRDLRAEVNAGTFRLDLYYRIAVVVVNVPPLRERVDDIPLLVEHFVREGGHAGPAAELFSRSAMEVLKQHRWPGNVRELRNVVDATMAIGEPPTLATATSGSGDPIDEVLGLPYREARARVLHQFEARYLARLIERLPGNVSRAARESGMDRSHLIDLLRRHRLKG